LSIKKHKYFGAYKNIFSGFIRKMKFPVEAGSKCHVLEEFAKKNIFLLKYFS
jgi:hypothetical protein